MFKTISENLRLARKPGQAAVVAAGPATVGDPKVAQQVAEFEEALGAIVRVPELFGKLVPNVASLNTRLKESRERYFLFEELYKEEQNKNNIRNSEYSTLKADFERLDYSFQREKSAHSALRQKSIEQESALSELHLTNADLNSRLGRLEPMVRELKITKDTLLAQLEKHQEQKEIADKTASEYKSEQTRLKEQLAKLLEVNNNLASGKQNLSDRVNETTKDLSARDATIAGLREQIAALTAKLKRETSVSNSLRTDNEQLIKDREDAKAQNESQLEAARGRYRVIERLLEESRVRYQSESQMLNAIRREKNQRDYDIVQLGATITAAKEDVADLRRQLMSSAEMSSELRTRLTSEVEKRRRIEIQLEVANEENGKLDQASKSSTALLENDRLEFETVIAELRGSIETLTDENERMRSELTDYRFTHRDADQAAETTPESGGTVVSITRT
ncbi:hypothetical protein [Hoeflea ulvae]|uniref:Crescentin coiled-coil domain-containing protein n=1 Tax=Hoeflea ulvae TaxID=2983764 RepID=A0ABT3YHC1_9HYPH|nr:hypothetical protein [Hoeflea ulvae]MCY0095130.1 hypothetical protein [Hoeflea ulvae]